MALTTQGTFGKLKVKLNMLSSEYDRMRIETPSHNALFQTILSLNFYHVIIYFNILGEEGTFLNGCFKSYTR